jgi:hypothetical protein
MFGHMPGEQVRDAIEQAALDVLAEARIQAPPVDAVGIARRLGMTVAREGPSSSRARFVNFGGAAAGTILLADEPRPERRQWAVAHELGEAYAHRVFSELGVDAALEAAGAREEVANRFAGCLLLPRDWFGADGAACEWDLAELKARFATASHELVARRMLEMRPPVIITLWDHGRLVWRRSNLPGRVPPVAACEEDVRRVAHEQGLAARCERSELPDGVDDVRAWPVHEEGWRREIVRTELTGAW